MSRTVLLLSVRCVGHLRRLKPLVDADQEHLSQSSERLEAYRILQREATWKDDS